MRFHFYDGWGYVGLLQALIELSDDDIMSLCLNITRMKELDSLYYKESNFSPSSSKFFSFILLYHWVL